MTASSPSTNDAAPERGRGGFSYKSIYVVFFGLLVCAAIAAGVMYWKFLYYERVAALHLPEDITFAARVDVEQAVMFEPVRKHLFSLVNELAVADPRLKPRAQRIQQHTRVEFAVDLREVLVALGPRRGDWMVALGGLFPKENLVSALQQVFIEEGQQPKLAPDGRLFTLANGLAVGQAEDGCILIAASAARLEAALPRQNMANRLLLARDGAAGLAVAGDFRTALADAAFVTAVKEIGGIKSAQVEVKHGNPLQVQAQIQFVQSTEPAETERAVNALLAGLRNYAAANPEVDHAGERRLLEQVRPSLFGPDSAVLVAPWDRADIDRGAESLARALRGWADGPKVPGVTTPR